MPRVKSNAPRRLDESQQGEVGDRLPFADENVHSAAEVVALSDHNYVNTHSDEVVDLSDDSDGEDYNVEEIHSDEEEVDNGSEASDEDLFSEAPEEYFELRMRTEIKDLEARQVFKDQNELDRLKARLGDDLEDSSQLEELQAHQSHRRKLELEDLANQRNLDLELRVSKKFIRVPDNILKLLNDVSRDSRSGSFLKSHEDPILGIICLHHAHKKEWCLRSVSSEMLIQLARNESKLSPVYIQISEESPATSSSDSMFAISYQVRLKREFCSKAGHFSDYLRFPRDFARAMNNLFFTSVNNISLLPESYIQSNIAKSNVDANELFEFLRDYHNAHTIPHLASITDPQHKGLIPKLRPYQANAVKWMIYKENFEEASKDNLHPLYEEVIADDGSVLYLNKYQGNIQTFKPVASPPPRGGILADEMGLGKTVEVLALLLTNVRPTVRKPDWKKPECVDRGVSKKLPRRKMQKLPVEFQIREDDEEKEEDQTFNEPIKTEVQLKSSNVRTLDSQKKVKLGSSLRSSDEEYEPSASASRQKKRKKVSPKSDGSVENKTAEKVVRFRSVGRKSANNSQGLVESGLIDMSMSSSSDEDYLPSTSTSKSKKRKKESSEEWAPKSVTRSKSSTRQLSATKRRSQPAKKKPDKKSQKSIPKDPTKVLAAELVKEFKPLSILSMFNKKKQTISFLVLFAIAEKNDMNPVSTSQIRTFVRNQNPKVTNKQILKEIRNHLESKMIFNATGVGASGSYVINPLSTMNNSDSRKHISMENLDAIDESIEKVITDRCYDGVPCSNQLELEVENLLSRPKEVRKKSSTYEALKKIYDEEMEIQIRRERRRRAWGGTFFDTKVEQRQYIECICGTETESEKDPLHRIQCVECGVWQHSLCVKFNVEDPYRGDYLCPHCWMQAEPVESGATLIISPNAIVHQWIEEIQKHIKHTNISVLFYKGTKCEGYIQPRKLANYDLVITTYTTLQSELHYVDLPHTNDSSGRRFRNPKRFLATPTALPCVNWWRVCLDEAQMIENPTSKTAEMALRLRAINRWCVSGTPMGKSLDDLYGLFVFLNVDPFNMYEWWNLVLSEPYNLGRTEPLKELLAKYMWRTSKIDVENQIDIPQQSEEVHWLRFSPVEDHFYRRIYYDAAIEMRRKLSTYDDDLSLDKIDRKTVKIILGPLLRLRQSCSHPQAVRGQFTSKIVKFTMTDLMTNLISKAKLECEDQNRIYISCLNGLAGLSMIREHYFAAADKYRDVLRFIDENSSKVKTDDLQRLHALTNLSEILKNPTVKLEKTLRDDQLDEEATWIRNQYLLKRRTSFTASENALNSATNFVKECQDSFLCNSSNNASIDEGAWYIQVIRVAGTQSEEETLLDFIRDEMIEFYSAVSVREINAVRDRYTSINKIKSKLFSKIDELDNIRDSIISEILNFHADSLNRFVEKAVECHLRKSVAVLKNKEKCELCNLNDQIAIYENTLFHFVKGDLKIFHGNSRQAISVEETDRLEKAGVFLHSGQRQGTWGDSEAERLLRALLKYSKQIDEKLSPEVLEDAKTHLKMFVALKKEFKALSVHCRLLFDQVAAYDELSMCTLRLRLRYPWEPKPKLPALKSLATMKNDKMEKINVLEEHEVGVQEILLSNDMAAAKTEFHKKLSQLEYLHNLENHTIAGGDNKENCPVCLIQFGRQWAVLECFHLLCMSCLTKLTEYRQVKCPICRAISSKYKISFVDIERKYKSTLDREAFEGLKGNFPTKLSAIVCQLKKMEVLDPGAKSLVFSSWVDVLKALGDALTENGIKFESLHDRGSFVYRVQKFKEDDSIKVLLIPFQTGASGLNLTVATHVFLAEPILHPGQELQAIGRIHRIGQTKPTVVHKFVIKNTIEEKIHRLTSTIRPGFLKVSPNSNECDMVTIKDLRLLFEDGNGESQSREGERIDLGDDEDDEIARYVNT